MSARLKPYPNYKDSGVEWLGRIPAHWQAMRLKWLLSKIGSGKTPKGGGQIYSKSGVLFLRSQNVHFDGLRLDDVAYISESIHSEMASTCVRRGDVLLNITGASLGRCGSVPDDLPQANVSQHVCILRPRRERVLQNFLSRSISSEFVQTQIFADEVGTSREGLAFEQIANLLLAVPDNKEEQQAVAEFLDWETGKIDALVKKKERLIELLQEKRKALISHAVTQGLNPNFPKKDSGIPWLGNIPKHWQLKKLGHVANIVRGGSPRPAGDPRFFDGDACPWITVAEITKDNGKFLNETETCLTDEGRRHSRFLHTGTLVMTNSGATLGVPKILNISGCINDGSVAFLDLKPFVVRNYLYYYLASLTENLRDRIKQGSGQPNLNTSIFRSIWFPVGDVDEQEQIVDYLDRETAKLDALMTKVRMATEQLQEYRTALISAAVTGQIDVRRVSAPRKSASANFLPQ